MSKTHSRPASTPHVVVIGGGFAGVQAAKAVTRIGRNASVTLIDPAGQATMIPALPDVVSGRISRQQMVRSHQSIFANTNVSLLRATVTGVDLGTRTVTTTDGAVQYDGLVIATGSRPEYYGFSPEGATLHGVDTFERAQRFRTALEAADPGQPLLIVGGGYTGLEAALSYRAGEDSRSREATRSSESSRSAPRRVIVVDAADALLTFLKESQRTVIMETLASSSIEVRAATTLTRATATEAQLSDGTVIRDPLICWAAGMRSAAPPLNTPAGPTVETTRDGRIVTEGDLSVPGYPSVFVAGDSAALTDGTSIMRRAVNFAFYSGRSAGTSVARRLLGKETRPFTPVDLGWVIPLGTTSVGKAFGWMPLGGRLGLRMHYAMCGLRHFGTAERRHFYGASLALRGRPDAVGSEGSA